jgi:NADPH2:quinone reductase
MRAGRHETGVPATETSAAARAAIIDAPGAVPRVAEITLPERTAGTSLLAVVAAPLNPLDLLIASGSFHSVRHEEPYVPGSECVGVILESDEYAPGTLVYAESSASPARPGSLATRTIVADDDVLVLPPGIDPVAAAAVGNSGVAAYLPLIEIAALRAGETVLVLGATGAVGQLAVQIARRHGAARVVGVGRNPDALARALTLGADAVVELRAGESADDLAARLSAAVGQADVVLDGLYGSPLEAALQICAPRSRIVNIGNVAGPVAAIPAGLLRGKQIGLHGFAGLHIPLAEKRSALDWLWNGLLAEDVTIESRTYSLDEVPTAWQAQGGSPHGKCVIVVDGPPPR